MQESSISESLPGLYSYNGALLRTELFLMGYSVIKTNLRLYFDHRTGRVERYLINDASNSEYNPHSNERARTIAPMMSFKKLIDGS